MTEVHLVAGCSLIALTLAAFAFGGAGPLHAARLGEKLGVKRILVPADAGVGSAVGFLLATVAYEVVRSRRQNLASLDAGLVNSLMEEMRAHDLTGNCRDDQQGPRVGDLPDPRGGQGNHAHGEAGQRQGHEGVAHDMRREVPVRQVQHGGRAAQ